MMDESNTTIIGLVLVFGNVFWHVYVGVMLGFTMLNIFFIIIGFGIVAIAAIIWAHDRWWKHHIKKKER